MTAIMGPSGSGKSTLLHCMAGLDRLTSGQIFLGDVELSRVEREAAHARSGATSSASSSRRTTSSRRLNALENITLPMSLAGTQARPGVARHGRDHGPARATGSTTVRRSCRVVSSSASPSARALLEPARDRLRRRAHREPRLAVGRRDPHVHARGGRRLRPDHRDGHPRPDRRRLRRPRRVPRRRQDRRRDARPDRRPRARQDEEPRASSRHFHVAGHASRGSWRRSSASSSPSIAVVLGVAFMSGTFVLTDTLGSVFDDLFTRQPRRTSTRCVARASVSSTTRPGRLRAAQPGARERCVTVVEGADGVKAADGTVFGFATVVGQRRRHGAERRQRPRSGSPGSPRHFGEPSSSPADGPRPAAARRGRDRQEDRERVAAIEVGDEVPVIFLDRHAGDVHSSSAIFRFGDSDSLAGATLAAFTPATAQRVLGRDGRVRLDRRRGEAGRHASRQLVANVRKVGCRASRRRRHVRGAHRQGARRRDRPAT